MNDNATRPHRLFRAAISAKWIPVLRHFMSDHNGDEGSEAPQTMGMNITPNPLGGVTLMATNGHIMCLIHDAEGDTNTTIRVSLPPHILDACEPPTLPTLWMEGDEVPPPYVPAWMSPKQLLMFEITALVVPHREEGEEDVDGFLACASAAEGNIYQIGREYRLYETTIKHRSAVPRSVSPLEASTVINPLYIGRISLSAHAAGAKAMRLSGSGSPQGPIMVEFIGVPEVRAFIMPMSDAGAPSLPDWLLSDTPSA